MGSGGIGKKREKEKEKRNEIVMQLEFGTSDSSQLGFSKRGIQPNNSIGSISIFNAKETTNNVLWLIRPAIPPKKQFIYDKKIYIIAHTNNC